ncbi:MAG: phosphoribosylglycinamide formyltransferase [Chloroflexi bacterium]|nr:phosphoribosylglycinamide formyltransferase [Chloroflexota bacterium]MBV9600630.1 phosphoribosylglycinamide formyltransferase [Chloroflexota bacterium]
MRKLAVLVSGGGTNLQALLEASRLPTYPARVVLVGCNRAGAPAIGRAEGAGVRVCIADRGEFPRRAERQRRLLDAARRADANLVVLAGFDEVLTPEFVAAFAGRMINTHPSLLPAFGRTLHAVDEALAHGVKVTGCTVHLVTDDLDGGPILLQQCVEVRDDDTAESLHARIREQEHRLLCEAVRALAEGRVVVEGRVARVIAS